MPKIGRMAYKIGPKIGKPTQRSNPTGLPLCVVSCGGAISIGTLTLRCPLPRYHRYYRGNTPRQKMALCFGETNAIFFSGRFRRCFRRCALRLRFGGLCTGGTVARDTSMSEFLWRWHPHRKLCRVHDSKDCFSCMD